MFEVKIIIAIFFSLCAILLCFSDNKYTSFSKITSGLWGGFLIQSFISCSQSISNISLFNLFLVIAGLIISLYFESKKKFHLIFLLCVICALGFYPSLAVFSALIASFLFELISSHIFKPSVNEYDITDFNSFLLYTITIISGFIIIPNISFLNSNIHILSLTSGALIYYASSKLSPENKKSNYLNLLGGLLGFFIGIIFY